MKRNLSQKLGYGSAILWSLITLLILMLVLALAGQTDYAAKNTFILPNVLTLAIGAAVCVGMALVYGRLGRSIEAFVARFPRRTVFLLSALLFLVQAYVFYQTFFLTGWDSHVVVDAAWRLFTGQSTEHYNWYFSCYPNNLLLVWLYRALFALNAILGDTAMPYYFIILFQCLLSTVTGGLLFSVVRRLSKPTYAYFAWLVYVVHVALSPWISILYSDAVALIFPMTILWLYQHSRTAKRPWLSWLGIGAAGYIGFEIKPQSAIALIAVVLVEGIGWLSRADKKAWLTRLKNTLSTLAAMALCLVLISQMIIPSLGFTLNPESEIGFTHFMMMGLNRETDGVYSDKDVLLSASFATTAERTKNNLWMVRERIRQAGFGGMVEHLSRKTMVIYGDGTYAWQKEGSFLHTVYESRNQTTSPFLRSFYYGNNIEYFKLFEQTIWLTLLLGSCGIVLWVKSERKENPVLFAMVLSLLGLTAFELLFEARARYLFLYAPVYIIVGLFGWIGWKRAVSAAIISWTKRSKRS